MHRVERVTEQVAIGAGAGHFDARLGEIVLIAQQAFQQPLVFREMNTCVQNELHDTLLTLENLGVE